MSHIIKLALALTQQWRSGLIVPNVSTAFQSEVEGNLLFRLELIPKDGRWQITGFESCCLKMLNFVSDF